jgi:hypothetical protein
VKRYDLSRNLIRIWVPRLEAGALDEDAVAAGLIEQYEARIGVPQLAVRGPNDFRLTWPTVAEGVSR